jgi:uncharacterized membrane protein
MSTDNRVSQDRLNSIDWLAVGLVLLSVLIGIVLASWALDSAASIAIASPADLVPWTGRRCVMWIVLLALALLLPLGVALVGLRIPLKGRPPGDDGLPFGGL